MGQDIRPQDAADTRKRLCPFPPSPNPFPFPLFPSSLPVQLTSLPFPPKELIPVVTSTNPSALYLYGKGVIQLYAGVASLKRFLTMEHDCGLLIPRLLSPARRGSQCRAGPRWWLLCSVLRAGGLGSGEQGVMPWGEMGGARTGGVKWRVWYSGVAVCLLSPTEAV